MSVKEQFTDLVEKKSEFARQTVIAYAVCTYRNQRGELVAKAKGWAARAERGVATESGKYSAIGPAKYTEEEIKSIRAGKPNIREACAQPKGQEL